MTGNFDPFPGCGVSAKTKFILLGTPDSSLLSWIRSLNLEHVSPAELMRLEISRRRSLPTAAEITLACMRRWFFARKPDAGFVLSGFPATLLQAKMLDEWLEVRGESLQGVFPAETVSADLIEHYRTLGLFIEEPNFAASV